MDRGELKEVIVGVAVKDHDVELKVALLIAELKDIAHRVGVEVSVLFHCVVKERERYFSTSFLDVLAEHSGRRNVIPFSQERRQ